MDAIQRPTNDSLHARQVQSQKTLRHHEDVEELDDAAVGSIRDESQQRHEQPEGGGGDEGFEEKLDIESLKAPPHQSPSPPPFQSDPQSTFRLDISA